ncbi:MAG: cyclic nucleotide-binding domain-containing protein [Terracidiphilus sp.]
MNLDPSAFLADPELIQALEKRSTPISCDQERVLFRQGDAPAGLYILHKGEATLTMRSWVGESVISLQTTAGSILGLPALIGNEPYTLTAIAHSGAQLSFVSRDDYAALMQANPLLPLKVLRVLAAEVHSARNAMLHR